MGSRYSGESQVLNIESYNVNSVTVLKLSGQLDAGGTGVLMSAITKLAPSRRRFVADMSQLEHIDSGGLGALVDCLKYLREMNGNLKLSGISDKHLILFDITRAYRIFEFYKFVDDAVASFELARQEEQP